MVKFLPRNKINVEFLKGQCWGPGYTFYVNDIHKSCESFHLQMTQSYIYIGSQLDISIWKKKEISCMQWYKWLCANILSLNANKTKYIVIRLKRRRCDLGNMNVFMPPGTIVPMGAYCFYCVHMYVCMYACMYVCLSLVKVFG